MLNEALSIFNNIVFAFAIYHIFFRFINFLVKKKSDIFFFITIRLYNYKRINIINETFNALIILAKRLSVFNN